MSLPNPPEAWMKAHGYEGWISDERLREARAAYAYEQEHGPPADPFPEGSRGHAQWTYRGKGDAAELAS